MAPNNLDFIVRVIDKFSGPMKTFAKGLVIQAKALAAMTAAAIGAGTAIVALTIKYARSSDAIGKFATRIGVSTEALSAYQHAADLSGVSNEQLNLSWQRMTRRVSEAAAGTGEAQGALKELNISAKELAQLSPDKQFEAVAGALSAVGSQSDKVRLAFKLFDAEGVGVLQMLEGGAEGLAAMTDEAKELGLVISEVAAKDAANFNDTMTRLMGITGSVFRDVAEKAMGPLTTIMKSLIGFVKENRSGFESLATKIGDMVQGVATWVTLNEKMITQNLASVLNGIGDAMDWINRRVQEFSLPERATEASKTLADLAAQGKVSREELQKVFSGWSGNTQLNELLEDGIIDFNEQSILSRSDNLMNDLLTLVKSKTDAIKAAAGGGAEAAEEKKAAEAQGSGQGTDQNVQATEENLAKLQAMHDEMFLTNVEREQLWYEEQQLLFTGNQEALTALAQVYSHKRIEAELKDKEEADKKQRSIDDKYAGFKNNLENNLSTIAQALGKKTFEAFKKTQYARAFIEAIGASVRAFEDYPFPASLGISLLAFTSALSSAAKIKGVSAAHGGIDNVPAESTYLLQRNERVLSPDQNREITNFVRDARRDGTVGGEGQQVTNIFYIGTVRANDPDALTRQAAEFTRNAQRDGVDLGQEGFAIG